MIRILRVALLLGALVASGCVLPRAAAAVEPSIAPPTCTSSPFTAALDAELQRMWPHNRFTAAVIDLRDECRYGYRPDLRMTTASVFKAEVLAGVLLRAQAGNRGLTAREHDLVWPMITQSANRPTSALYGELGGASGFDSLNRRLGLGETQPAPSIWGLTRTSARDQAYLARQLLIGDVGPLSPASVDTAWRYMGSVVPSQRWGVGEGLPPGFRFGLKNGFAPSQCCGWRINTSGAVVDPRGGGWTMAILTDGWGSEAAGRRAMTFIAESVNRSMARRPPVDVVAIKHLGDSGVELHALAGAEGYRSFAVQAATGLTGDDGQAWSFALGDRDHDARLDLFAVKHRGDSGQTEVHVLSGASGWRQWTLHAATGLGATDAGEWSFSIGDYNLDGVDDLFAIAMAGRTGTEVHVLDGASGFATFLAHHATGLHATSSDGWALDLVDFDRDGQPDLVAVSLNGSAGTELHVLSGAAGYQSFIVQAATALPATRSEDWAFSMSDSRGEGAPDLVAVSRAGETGTEVHILDGATSWSSFSLHTATPLHPTDGAGWTFLN